MKWIRKSPNENYEQKYRRYEILKKEMKKGLRGFKEQQISKKIGRSELIQNISLIKEEEIRESKTRKRRGQRRPNVN